MTFSSNYDGLVRLGSLIHQAVEVSACFAGREYLHDELLSVRQKVRFVKISQKGTEWALLWANAN